MAYTYASTPTLSKIKMGTVTYALKDADVRAILDGFNNDIVTGALAANSSSATTTIATLGVVKDYVDAQVGAINKFDVAVTTTAKITTTPTEDDMYILYLVPADNAAAGSYVEYIVIRSGSEGSYTYRWEQIGNTTVDLTGYLSTDATVAGVGFTNGDVPTASLKQALGIADFTSSSLGALAYKDNASGSSSTQYVSAVGSVDYTPAGSVSVAMDYISTPISVSGNYQPTGSISGSVTPNGEVTVSKENDTAQATFQAAGTVSAPTVSVSLNSDTFVKSASLSTGTTPSFTEGAFTAATITYSTVTFATSGVVASIDATDNEMLVFTDAITGNASSISAFNGGSKAADTFNAGAFPTLTASTASAAISVASATAATPTFTGDYYKVDFTGNSSTISATFTGTTSTVSVSGNYDRAGIQSATFTGTSATIAPTVTTSTVSITVS